VKEIIVAAIAQEYSLFEIDRELDGLLDRVEEEIETLGEASSELVERFQAFCEAHGEKADRIGRFLRMMEARVQYCRAEAARLQDRARSCDRKVTQTKNMVLYYLMSRELKKIEGRDFTLRIQKNSQDSIRFIDESQVPMCLRKVEACFEGQLWEKVIASVSSELKHMLIASIRETAPSNEAIKQAVQNGIPVPGVEVYRGNHLRVA
jgi:Siphovirus Gp157